MVGLVLGYTELSVGNSSSRSARHCLMSIVFVISAPSGAGKSTLVERVVARDSRLEFAVSVTTRPPRTNEIDGEAYRFVSKDRFIELRDAGEFLEWAEVFGNYYGTPRSAIAEARAHGCDLLLDIDVQGASSLEKQLSDSVKVFVLPPSSKVLAQRLRDRSLDDQAVIERRLGEASRVVGSYRLYDYVVINEDIDESSAMLHCIFAAERSKRGNMEPAIEPILNSFGIEPEAREGDTE